MNYSTKLMLTALAATTVICADAQVTTSAINGLVLDDNKEPVIGATVTPYTNLRVLFMVLLRTWTVVIRFKVCVLVDRIKWKSLM